MKYLHTMVRVTDIDKSLAFYCQALGLTELKRYEVKMVVLPWYLTAEGDEEAQVELTHNWDPSLMTADVTSAIWRIILKTFMPPASDWRITAS